MLSGDSSLVITMGSSTASGLMIIGSVTSWELMMMGSITACRWGGVLHVISSFSVEESSMIMAVSSTGSSGDDGRTKLISLVCFKFLRPSFSFGSWRGGMSVTLWTGGGLLNMISLDGADAGMVMGRDAVLDF